MTLVKEPEEVTDLSVDQNDLKVWITKSNSGAIVGVYDAQPTAEFINACYETYLDKEDLSVFDTLMNTYTQEYLVHRLKDEHKHA
jgi:hypothetical protein